MNELVEDLKVLESLNPAFVVVTGDLVQNAKKEEFEFYKEAIQQTPLWIVNVLGNHDVGITSTANYVSFFGPTHYGFDYGGCHFVVLNSCSDAAIQSRWLKAELALQPKNVF